MLHSQCSQFPLLQFHFVDFICQLSDSFIKLELTRWKVESLSTVQYYICNTNSAMDNFCDCELVKKIDVKAHFFVLYLFPYRLVS